MESKEADVPKALTFHGITLRDGWQSGEIKPSRPFGLLVGATTFVAIAMQTVFTQGELTSSQRAFQAVAAVCGIFAIWAGGKGTSWNDKGVISWLYGRKITWRSWEDFSAASLSRMSLASVLRQREKSPDSPMTRFLVATQVYKRKADPRHRTYEPPPSFFRSVCRSLAGVGMAALVTFAAALLLPDSGLGDGGESIWLKALVLGAFVGSVIAGSAFAVREICKSREPWRWKPVAEPSFDFRLTQLSNRKARELLVGKYYMHKPPQSFLDGFGSGISVFPLAAVISGMKMLVGPVSAEFLTLAAAVMTALCIAVSWLSEWLKKLSKRKTSPVDPDAIIECTESGLRLWKDGASSGYLRYPHPLTTGSVWSPSVLEAWSDGETSYTIDRARLIEVPVYFPEATYALTEGNGWMTPESKAIAGQMLTERDWSKPLPKEGQ